MRNQIKMDVNVNVAAAYIVLNNHANNKRKQRKKRQMWMRSFLSKRDALNNLTVELMLDSYLFKNFTRMAKSDFELLLHIIGPKIQKTDTNMRKSIANSTRLAITLRFLSTGDSYHSLMYLFRVHYTSICSIVAEVCEALIDGLKEYIKLPSTDSEWKNIAKDFEDRWNFPHCVGAMDGKHIAIVCPPNSGSKYYNYRHFFSTVLFAVVNADYKFIYVHVGCQGRISDGGVFRHTSFGKSVLDHTLNLPEPKPLRRRGMAVPYVFLADDAFPLTENICKPYSIDLNVGSPKRVCNYRISRGRRVVENTFGLLASVFRILYTTINLHLENTQKVIMTCAYLHNFLRRNPQARILYSPPGVFDIEDTNTGNIIPGSWRNSDNHLTPLQYSPRNATTRAKAVRDEFMNFFMSNEGRVTWQDTYL